MDPAQGGEGKSLYVGNLAKSVTQVLLYEVFGALGQVTSVKLITDKISGDSQGYGFVDYIDHETAEMAMNALNGRDLYGNELRINWAAAALNKEDTSTHHHIFVGDLAPEVDDGSLWEAFQSFGSISEARVVRDPSGGNRSKGYGFVAFREHADAQNAMRQMTGACIGSRVIRCNWQVKNLVVRKLLQTKQQIMSMSCIRFLKRTQLFTLVIFHQKHKNNN